MTGTLNGGFVDKRKDKTCTYTRTCPRCSRFYTTNPVGLLLRDSECICVFFQLKKVRNPRFRGSDPLERGKRKRPSIPTSKYRGTVWSHLFMFPPL